MVEEEQETTLRGAAHMAGEALATAWAAEVEEEDLQVTTEMIQHRRGALPGVRMTATLSAVR